jgi:hypothetical protein
VSEKLCFAIKADNEAHPSHPWNDDQMPTAVSSSRPVKIPMLGFWEQRNVMPSSAFRS